MDVMTLQQFQQHCLAIKTQPITGCRLWDLGRSRRGIPVVFIKERGLNVKVVNLIVSLRLGREPQHTVRHTCRNDLCIESEHIFEDILGRDRKKTDDITDNKWEGIDHSRSKKHERSPWRASVIIDKKKVILGYRAKPESARALVVAALEKNPAAVATPKRMKR